MTEGFDEIRTTVAAYYARRLAAFGAEHRGVDWSTAESQRLRFDVLLSVVGRRRSFSLNDWGCGYGALLDHMRAAGFDGPYTGYDIAPEMVAAAGTLHAGDRTARFVARESDLETADFTVASGIFNVKLGTPDAAWSTYMASTIDAMAAVSRRGFAFNALSMYSDPEKRRADLHYAHACEWFDYCKTKHSRFVSLLHDAPLWEFTVIVSREPQER